MKKEWTNAVTLEARSMPAEASVPAALNIVDFKDAAHPRLTLFNSTSHYSTAEHPVPSVPKARLSKWWDEGTKNDG